MEVIKVHTTETVVVTAPAQGRILVERQVLEVAEVATQGPPGPPGPPGESESQQYDTDLVLIYQTAKL